MQMTKGEQIVAEALGNMPKKDMPVLTEQHPFLRKVIKFMGNRREWQGTVKKERKEADMQHKMSVDKAKVDIVTLKRRDEDLDTLFKPYLRGYGIGQTFGRTF